LSFSRVINSGVLKGDACRQWTKKSKGFPLREFLYGIYIYGIYMPIILPSDLTATQVAIWLDQQLFIGKPIYNTGQALTIRGRLRVDLFEIALRATVAESPSLRLPPRSGPITFDLTLQDFRKEKDPLAAAEQWMRIEMGGMIPLEDPALFRFALIRISEDHTLWFQKYHHIIIDATGRRLLSARTAHRYRALRFGKPLSAMRAATPQELLDVERRYCESNIHEVDRGYWLEQFAKWPGPLHEAKRQNTERAKSGRHARITFRLKRADFTRLDSAASELGSSAFRAIIALTFAAFARLYDRYDIVLGLELANRPDEKTKQTIGFVARPLPMLLRLARTMTVADAVGEIEETRARNYPHRHFPIQELARELGITRKGHHGLFDIVVNYIPATYDFSFEDFPVDITNLSYGFSSPWTVTIADTGSTRDLDVSIDTDPGLIPAEMAARLATSLEILLLRGFEDPACPLASLPIMPEAIREQVLGFAAGETVSLPEGTTLATLCAAQAERTPDAIALIFDEQQLSFATLHEQAARLARRLAAHGVRPGVVVGIALPRSPAMVIAVLAVHKAGGAYLALDPSYPVERIRFIVTDAAAPVILTNAALAPVFADSGARLLLETDPETTDTEIVETVAAGSTDLAYVLYTSGSTGRPKAVGIAHRNLINLISWGRSIVSETELRGLLFSTSLNFDLSAFEMFLPLVCGGCIVLVENLFTLQSAPQREKVRLVNSGPSLLDTLLRTSRLPPGVTTIILAGEKLPRRLATSVFESDPGIRLLNCYGPTETTVYSSCAAIDPADHREPTIGRAIWNTTLYVLDAGRALVPPGAEGELFIGGAGVAHGYLGRSDLTAERFLPNPYGPGQLYRTGDRVRWRADGELEYLGRADDQIKINGIRIEPGEIEATLLALPGIAAAVVTLYEDASDVRRLIAYLAPSAGAAPEEENVRAALERQLPRNMVPTVFVWLDVLPLTPNGKLDRKSLPAPPREEALCDSDRLPVTRMEHEIADIWQDLLQVSPIGIGSDFFDLGGDSLALLSLFAAIEDRFGRHLTVDVLAGGLTVARLARLLAGDEPLRAEMGPVVALQPVGHRPPFFGIPGIGGDVVNLHRLAVHMGTDRPFLALRRLPEARLSDSINQIAARYVAAVLTHQPAGPFYLGGYSFGAVVAYEMAVQLVQQGHAIGLLAIIDQRKPGWRLRANNVLPVLHRFLARIPGRIRDEFTEASSTDRFRRIGRLLSSWSKTGLGDLPNAVSILDGRPSETEQILSIDANLQAMRDYKPTPLPVPITLFRANTQWLSHLALDSTLGWSDLAKIEVRVRTVPGNHATIITEPLVRQLAKILSDELDAAQKSAPV
jgi:amino acid adenylation domain-containing protein